MSIVDELMAMPGVIVAGEYTYKAETDYYQVAPQAEMTDEYARMLGVMCHATTKGMVMSGNMLARFQPRHGLRPERGWLVRGPDFTICVVANVFCFFNNQQGSPGRILGFMRKALAGASMNLV